MANNPECPKCGLIGKLIENQLKVIRYCETEWCQIIQYEVFD